MNFDLTRDAAYRLPGIPERRPLGVRWVDRLDEWRDIVTARSFPEFAHVQAGDRGELLLRQALGRHEVTRFGELFCCKRVTRVAGSAAAGRFELDIVVVTPRRIVVFEVKHWSGRLRLVGQDWVYERRSGETLRYSDLADYNAEKLAALRRYLTSQGLVLPANRFEQRVVFTHPRIELDAALARDPRIVCINELATALPRAVSATSATSYLLAALIERCASSEAATKLADGLFDLLPPKLTAAAASAIARLRGWDVLRLHGGRELIGDLLWLQFDGARVEAGDLPVDSAAALHWRRSRWLSLLPLLGFGAFGRINGPLVEPRNLRSHDCVYFHEVGQARPSVISLVSVDAIRTG